MPTTTNETARAACVAAAAAALALGCFWRARECAFAFDDHLAILGNADVTTPAPPPPAPTTNNNTSTAGFWWSALADPGYRAALGDFYWERLFTHDFWGKRLTAHDSHRSFLAKRNARMNKKI